MKHLILLVVAAMAATTSTWTIAEESAVTEAGYVTITDADEKALAAIGPSSSVVLSIRMRPHGAFGAILIVNGVQVGVVSFAPQDQDDSSRFVLEVSRYIRLIRPRREPGSPFLIQVQSLGSGGIEVDSISFIFKPAEPAAK